VIIAVKILLRFCSKKFFFVLVFDDEKFLVKLVRFRILTEDVIMALRSLTNLPETELNKFRINVDYI
jgi:hypothetical protein